MGLVREGRVLLVLDTTALELLARKSNGQGAAARQEFTPASMVAAPASVALPAPVAAVLCQSPAADLAAEMGLPPVTAFPSRKIEDPTRVAIGQELIRLTGQNDKAALVAALKRTTGFAATALMNEAQWQDYLTRLKA